MHRKWSEKYRRSGLFIRADLPLPVRAKYVHLLRTIVVWCIFCYRSCEAGIVHDRCRSLGYCSYNQKSYSRLISDADESFFKRVIIHDGHVLQSLFLERPAIPYSLRERTHNTTLIPKNTQLNDDDFLIRMLYKDVYCPDVLTLIFSFCCLSQLRLTTLLT